MPDNGPLAKGIPENDKGSLPTMLVAIVFDDTLRPETTGGYCYRALKQLVPIEHIRPSQLAQMDRRRFDLFVNIDDGIKYRLPMGLHPTVYWAIDTHMDMDWCLEKSRQFDFVFAAQRDGAERLSAAGITASWLPLGCDPEVHGRQQVEKLYDLCFIGNLHPGPRADLVSMIQAKFERSFVGQHFFEAMAATYSASRIVFNRSVKNDVNMRVFEALASGSFLLTNDLSTNGQNELFRDGVHLATYTDAEELFDKIRFYLKHEEVRERIASRGRQEVLARHTYRDRMETILVAVRQSRTDARLQSQLTVDQSALSGAQKRPEESLAALDCGAQIRIDSNSTGHSLQYFDCLRTDLLARVRPTARRILDIGCGTGRLGASLKARQPAHVTGIELNAHAASCARQRLDTVIAGDIERIVGTFAHAAFDCVICGDVLEHLKRPDLLLRKLHDIVEPRGQLLASIPNVRNTSVLTGLLEGNWTYEHAGLLDDTHLRFFTRLDIERLFYRAGYTVRDIALIPDVAHSEWESTGSPTRLQLGCITVAGVPSEEVEEFFVYQYLIDATPTHLTTRGMTTLVIVTLNARRDIAHCVASVREYTDEPYEIVFVDNGSSDGTLEYLHGIPGSRVITNTSNGGFPAAVNQGLAVAGGDQVVLLNNDVVVTTGWLRRMLEALASERDVGLVGPLTNYTSGPQRVEMTYRTVRDLEAFAWRLAEHNQGRRFDAEALTGSCLMISSACVGDIGAFDERFGIGACEQYSRRAKQAGYRAIIAADSYVHHYGHRTFAATEIVGSTTSCQ